VKSSTRAQISKNAERFEYQGANLKSAERFEYQGANLKSAERFEYQGANLKSAERFFASGRLSAALPLRMTVNRARKCAA
jgi:hypothetical protein